MNAKWTATHKHFDNGNSGKVYTLGRVEVTKGSHLESGAEGWTVQYHGIFATETHRGFRTLAEAKAAGEKFQG